MLPGVVDRFIISVQETQCNRNRVNFKLTASDCLLSRVLRMFRTSSSLPAVELSSSVLALLPVAFVESLQLLISSVRTRVQLCCLSLRRGSRNGSRVW